MDSIQEAVTKLVETVGELARVVQGLREVVEAQQKSINTLKCRGIPEVKELALVNGKSIYVSPDQYGRIVISEAVLEKLSGSSPKDFRETQVYKEMLAHVGGKSNE